METPHPGSGGPFCMVPSSILTLIPDSAFRPGALPASAGLFRPSLCRPRVPAWGSPPRVPGEDNPPPHYEMCSLSPAQNTLARLCPCLICPFLGAPATDPTFRPAQGPGLQKETLGKQRDLYTNLRSSGRKQVCWRWLRRWWLSHSLGAASDRRRVGPG